MREGFGCDGIGLLGKDRRGGLLAPRETDGTRSLRGLLSCDRPARSSPCRAVANHAPNRRHDRPDPGTAAHADRDHRLGRSGHSPAHHRRQVYVQWRDKSSAGLSKWLFIGQISASISFVAYSLLLGELGFRRHECRDARHGDCRADCLHDEPESGAARLKAAPMLGAQTTRPPQVPLRRPLRIEDSHRTARCRDGPARLPSPNDGRQRPLQPGLSDVRRGEPRERQRSGSGHHRR